MTLFRAIYQNQSGKLRGMTYAARDAETAAHVAEDWQIYDRLLIVKPLRALNPELELTS